MYWKCKAWLPAIVVALHAATGYAASKDEQQIKTDCAKLDQYSQAGATAYQQGDMARAVEEYTAQVAWSEFCRLPAAALNTAYNNVALALIKSGEPLQANAWLSLAAGYPKTQVNRALIQPVLDRLQPALAATPMGVYWRYAGQGVWSTVTVMPDGPQWKITFNGYYMTAMGMYYGPNMGEFSVSQPINDGKAVYIQDADHGDTPCQVNMAFSPASLQMDTVSGDCGFGMNVRASGTFLRVSLY